jgi:hypothetical protein
MLSFLFDKAETAFKYVVLIFMLQYIIPLLLQSFIFGDSQAVQLIFEILFPLMTLNNNI